VCVIDGEKFSIWKIASISFFFVIWQLPFFLLLPSSCRT
jgi:hypothetical protein